MKKIITAFISLALILTILPSGTAMAARNNIVEYEEGLPIFSILTGNEYDEMKNEDSDRKISRVEFCDFVCNYFDLKTMNTEVNFIDLKKDEYYYTSVATLVEWNAIAKSRYFRPDDIITVDEALKVLLSLGGWQTYAEFRGGFPEGYRYMARELRVLPNGIGNEVDFKTMVSLIVALGDTGICSLDSFGYETVYVQDEEQSILSTYRGIKKIKEGLVENIYGISSGVQLSENEIEIDDNIYITADIYEPYEYFGRRVNAYYVENKDKFKQEIISISPIVDDDDMTITADEFYSFAGNTLHYYDDKEKLRDESIEPGAIYIYNNSLVSENVSLLFDDFYKGTIDLRDTDNDGNYDLVLIKSYELNIINFYDSNQMILYNYIGVYDKLDLTNVEILNMKSQLGIDMNEKNLLKDTPVLIAKSKDDYMLDIMICTETNTDKLSAYSDERKIEFGEIEFKIDDKYYQHINNTFVLGLNYTYVIDKFGEICFIKPHNEYSIGYLYKYGINDEHFSEELVLKLFTETGEHVKYTCAEKVKIDGKTLKKLDQIMLAFYGADGTDIDNISIPNQLIRYSLNSEGFINKIDTLETVSGDDTDVLICDSASTDELQAFVSHKRLGQNVVLSSNTTVLIIPKDEEIHNADENQFAINKGMASFQNDKNYSVVSYQVSKDSEFSDYLIYKASVGKTMEECMPLLVDKIIGVYENDEVFQRIEGIGASSQQCNVRNGVDLSHIAQGDLIRYSISADGYVDEIEILYDASEGGVPTTWPGLNNGKNWYTNTNGYRQKFQLSFGYAAFKGNNVVGWDFDYDGITDERYDVTTNKIPIYVYDESLGRYQSVYVGGISDIIDYRTSSSSCSRIIFASSNNKGQAMFVYK